MRHVKTKNSITVLTILSLLTSCKEQKKYSIEKQEVKEPLVFKVDFKNYGEYQIKMNKEKWRNHEKDSIIYFDVLLANLKNERLKIKTSTVSSSIPILLKYSKAQEDLAILEIVQQFNTVYSDSIILRNDKISDFPIVENTYRIGYQHNGVDEICQLKVDQHHDTINISSQKIGNCIERKR
ncbi:hypothetical protein EG346_05210 [Chryseobacterium carnipullorum]|uniref:Lipoprotein n=1 Tax=Chryseobacterium carnipullorum TaxID=1124835 RepID=A0A376EL29_CHRCU|nr:hypothetical protein [Chryseobacterium carnipullorum]AZA47622.1 hypothetical protein EG346_05210 [Chryseobacterium carnipullorum]AZA66948.1 hypothetical protein EG345_21345 [Chryseobacterium carnipullorum]STD10924.1 Uncharacterised protein [Chryseobacterium carnipullorum]